MKALLKAVQSLQHHLLHFRVYVSKLHLHILKTHKQMHGIHNVKVRECK